MTIRGQMCKAACAAVDDGSCQDMHVRSAAKILRDAMRRADECVEECDAAGTDPYLCDALVERDVAATELQRVWADYCSA